MSDARDHGADKAHNSPPSNSAHVLLRFGYRVIVLCTFAAISTNGFGTMLAALLAFSTIYCAAIAAMRREAVFGPVLTYWDEAAAYALFGHVVHRLS
jgi:hypothetical protein